MFRKDHETDAASEQRKPVSAKEMGGERSGLLIDLP